MTTNLTIKKKFQCLDVANKYPFSKSLLNQRNGHSAKQQNVSSTCSLFSSSHNLTHSKIVPIQPIMLKIEQDKYHSKSRTNKQDKV
jgi:hypothetical protein